MVLWVVVRVLSGEYGLEKDRGLEAEALQVGVKELPSGVDPRSLEGVACHHGGMGVNYQDERQRRLQATHLRVLNQDLV